MMHKKIMSKIVCKVSMIAYTLLARIYIFLFLLCDGLVVTSIIPVAASSYLLSWLLKNHFCHRNLKHAVMLIEMSPMAFFQRRVLGAIQSAQNFGRPRASR